MKLGRLFSYLILSFGLTFTLLQTFAMVIDRPLISLVNPKSQLESRLDTLISKLDRLQRIEQNGIEVKPIRQGFPYCEPFTGALVERPNTNVGGIANLTALPGQNNGVLQLTDLTPDALGYAFIDLPFSSTYGIKVSFEYFIYNPDPTEDPGDGISFFLYDGAISASDFRIGGLGGSLGYSPHGTYSPTVPQFYFTGDPGPNGYAVMNEEGEQGYGGLNGGYLGVGFDVKGNYGNAFQRRYGGFEAPNDYWTTTMGYPGLAAPRYPHSVVVRGPQERNPNEYRRNGMPKIYSQTGNFNPPFDSYQFVTGKITYEDPAVAGDNDIIEGVGSLGPEYFISPQFKLNTLGRVNDCSQNGYRKVFIDFRPINPLNLSQGYNIKIDMLVNDGAGISTPINIIDQQFNPAEIVPQTFKLGFAGATGANQAYQEIRNVTVQVSNENSLTKPETDALVDGTCVDEEEFFELAVDLNNQGAFIQCIQLYKTEQDALEVQEDLEDIVGVQDCESGICNLALCVQERLTEETNLGYFEAFIFEENGVETPKIKFTSKPGVTGSSTIWYTVTDNFGQISDPKPITINIDPYPSIDKSGVDIMGPTCDGQNDGSISGVVVSGLGQTYDYQWYTGAGLDANGMIINPVPISGGSISGISGVNLGYYYLEVTNITGGSNCPVVEEFEIIDERGTPVVVEIDDQAICEGGSVTFVPRLEDASDGNNPIFKWYSDPDKSPGSEITNGLVIGGVTFTLNSSNGELTVDGLAPSATPYVYYVEVDNPANNLCASEAGNLTDTKVTVGEGVDYDVTKIEDDWCLDNGGVIQVNNLTGGDGSYLIELLDESLNVLQSKANIPSSGTTFTGLAKGNYIIQVTSGSPPCISSSPMEEIFGPDDPLSISILDQIDPSCATDNGEIQFQVSGGTAPYSFTLDGLAISPTQSSGIYIISGLGQASGYELKVQDANSCIDVVNSNPMNAVPVPVFKVSTTEICPSETAVITVDDSGKSNATNIVYNWTNIDGSPLVNGNGVTFTQNPTTGELTVSGLSEDQLTYDYKLQVTGDNVCLPTNEIATVSITPTPKVDVPLVTDVSCNGGADGTITVSATDPATSGDYEYSLDGGNTYQNNGAFSGLIPGTYTVRVRNKTGSQCYKDIPDLIVEEPDLLTFNTNPTDPTCDTSNGEIEVTVTGGVADYTVSLMLGSSVVESQTSNGTPINFGGLAPNTYTIYVEDANSCSTSSSVTLTNDPGFSFTIDPMSDEICFGQEASITPVFTTDGVPTITWYKDAAGIEPVISSSTPDANGLITQINSDNTLSVEGLPVGNHKYYLEVSGVGYCPYPFFEAVITVFEPLEATPEIENEICYQGEDGTITVNATGADGNYTYSLDGGPFVSTNVFTDLAKGTYTIDVQSGNGCDFQVNATVDGPTAPISTNTPDIIRESCNLGNGIIDNLMITGGWGGYSVEWRRGAVTGPVVPGDETSAKDLVPDTYYLIVTDSVGCSEVFDFEVTAQPLPDYQMTQALDECEGVPITFTPINIVSGSSPTEVRWFKGAGQTDEIQNGPDASNPDIIYTIDDSDWVNPTLEIDGLPAGIYTYYFYVECTGQEIAVDVEVFPIPEVDFESSPETCFGAEDGKIKVASGGNSSQIYFVDGGTALTQEELEDLLFAPKIYDIRVEQDGVGCPSNFQIEVLGPNAELSVEPLTKIDPGCGADIGIIHTQITGGWAPYEVTVFKDGTALNTQTVTGPDYKAIDLAPGEYYLSVVDEEGCPITSNSVTLVYGPTQVLVDDIEICESGVAVLKPTLNPVASGATFEWFKGPGATNPIASSTTPDANGHIFEIASDGTLTISGLENTDSPVKYYVRATGGGICPGGFAEPTVEIFDQPTVDYSVQNEVCFGENGTITLTGSGGSGIYEYSLDGTTFQSSNVFSVAPGSYVATIRSGGCENTSSSILVEGPAAPISNSTPVVSNPTCGQANGVIQFSISGGYGSYSVESFLDGSSLGLISTSGGFELTNLMVGDYTFFINDGKGCFYPIDTPISIVDGLTPLEALDQQICEGEVANITPTSSQVGISPTFTWYQNSDGTGEITSGTSSGITYQVDSDGTLNVTGLPGDSTPYTYYVGVSGAGVCPPPLEAVEVMVYPIPNLRVSNPSIVCDPNGTVDLTQYIEGFNSTIYDYQIEDPSGQDMRLDEIQSVNESGSYIVQSSVKGSNCWNLPQRILVKIAEKEMIPEFNYQFDFGGGNILVNTEVQILEQIDFMDISVGDVVIWNWDFGDGGSSSEQNPTHTFNSKGIFTVTLTTIDEIGCVASFQRVIEVRDDYLVMIPNAFTPDGQKNQYFKPYYRGIASMDFYIFNPWGELIYHASSLEDLGWDGSVNGKPAPNGNYVYRGTFVTRSGEKVDKSGVFVLIR